MTDISTARSMEEINDFVEAQLMAWPEARERYLALAATERRILQLGDLRVAVQHNPARIVSTGAKIDSASIKERPCFLCESNRPKEQFIGKILPGWQLLVNPFPIFPIHLTLPTTDHRPQDRIPPELASMAEKMPGMAVFFNGARAGASAPDHCHAQAVLASELPLVALAEKIHPSSRPGVMHSSESGADLPFSFLSAVITPDAAGMRALMQICSASGVDADTGKPDHRLMNAIMWIGKDSLLRAVAIPRRRHRPLCYGSGEHRMLISPGTIDMAGVIVAPRKEDFEAITEADLRRIYSEVAFS